MHQQQSFMSNLAFHVQGTLMKQPCLLLFHQAEGEFENTAPLTEVKDVPGVQVALQIMMFYHHQRHLSLIKRTLATNFHPDLLTHTHTRN